MQVSSDEKQRAAASRFGSTRIRVAAAPLLTWFALLLACTLCQAQRPGTFPPSDVITDSASGTGGGEGLPIRGFMFLDASGNPVMIPSMTYERLRELESGSHTAQRPFVFKSLQIDGKVDQGRAELNLVIRLSIDSTAGRLIPISLKMGNFHLLRAPEFTSSPPGVPDRDVERMTIGPDGSGYVLWVRADRPRDMTVKMSVSARADQAARDSLYFRLPDVPAKINIAIPQTNAVGEINGRGDEVIRPLRKSGGTEFRIESGGGSFQLHWGQQPSAPANTAQLEVQSSIIASWNAPEDRPSLSIQWKIQSLRGQVGIFDVQLPTGAQLSDDPILVASGLAVKVTEGSKDGRIRVAIPPDERGDSIDLSLNLTLNAADAGSDGWLDFQIPQIIGALRQEGDVTVKTVGDYRLRWRSSRGIQRTLDDALDDTPNIRSYSFQFDRGAFVMPILLSAQRQKLRLACETDVILGEASASLEMAIRSSGEASDSRQIELDFAGWDQHSIVDAESGEDLVIGTSGSKTQISLTQEVGGQASLIRVTAVRSIASDNGTIRFTLPRIDASDDALLIESNDVTIRSSGRSALVVDLEQSAAIESAAVSSAASRNAMVSQFRVQPPRAQAKVVGSMVQQPPQITLESSANIMLEGSQLVTTVDWLVTSASNLKGRLDVGIPPSLPSSTLTELAEAAGLGSYLNGPETSDSTGTDAWTVTINGRAGLLSAIDRSRYELKSGLLGEGTFNIRWRNVRPIVGDETQAVSLPRLRDADVEVRGDITVTLSGNQETELHAADTPQRNTLQFGEPPREPIRIRLVKRATREQELSVRRAVLRTAVGKNTRYEQVLAIAQGDESFRVSLSADVKNLKAEAYVDNQKASVRPDGDSLSIALPGDQRSHIVDLRVWVDEPSSGLFAEIKPALKLPIGVGRVFWQITVPYDSHVVWVAPTIGQAMTWQLDGWRLERQPIFDDEALCERIGPLDVASMPPGNQYLYVGSDILSFRATIASRSTIWLLVGGIVLAIATAITYIPLVRTPITAIVGAFFFAGLLALAPDAAVLVGQFAIVAMVLVIVMFAVRSLLVPRHSRLLPQRAESPSAAGSTRTATEEQASPGSSVQSTETMVPPEPSEVSP